MKKLKGIFKLTNLYNNQNCSGDGAVFLCLLPVDAFNRAVSQD
ncbi:hypothetical protein ACGCUQ_06680 [Eubacteriales bacterium KG127]